MRIFDDPSGSGKLWFANLTAADGTPVGYDPQRRAFVASSPFCVNRTRIGCNWIAREPGTLCQSCAMTALTPDAAVNNAVANWAQTESAKRWVLDNLGQWGWFRPEDPGIHPVFHMLAEGPTPVSMGHIEGVVTISVAEADDVVRITRRQALDEPHRSLVGHMRHEIAHMIWWRLSQTDSFLDEFRMLFGDERANYSAALHRHYNQGPPADWPEHHLTAYASAHPHEDWAETAANLIHLTDIADSFVAAGLNVPALIDSEWKPYAERDPARLINAAISIGMSINHVNRSMGLPDLYPFVICRAAHQKLHFAHKWLRRGAGGV